MASSVPHAVVRFIAVTSVSALHLEVFTDAKDAATPYILFAGAMALLRIAMDGAAIGTFATWHVIGLMSRLIHAKLLCTEAYSVANIFHCYPVARSPEEARGSEVS